MLNFMRGYVPMYKDPAVWVTDIIAKETEGMVDRAVNFHAFSDVMDVFRHESEIDNVKLMTLIKARKEELMEEQETLDGDMERPVEFYTDTITSDIVKTIEGNILPVSSYKDPVPLANAEAKAEELAKEE